MEHYGTMWSSFYDHQSTFPNERDICKWKQFPNKLDIYDSKDLYELGILSKFDERILVHEKFRIKHIQI